MKRVKLLNGRDFVLSAIGDVDMLGINANIVKMFVESKVDIYIDADPNQLDPQGYLFFIKAPFSSTHAVRYPVYMPMNIGVYDWELQKFFKVFD